MPYRELAPPWSTRSRENCQRNAAIFGQNEPVKQPITHFLHVHDRSLSSLKKYIADVGVKADRKQSVLANNEHARQQKAGGALSRTQIFTGSLMDLSAIGLRRASSITRATI
ncbi:hypothetical protein TcasGA2_TC003722 [Tribolium castaneum]|uniref:Uncharacterized protein n=1 Tax=Tribolium castaneum TaxID=7070 RepID=D6WDV4_TRICA|nr:hypothetical protein TcasGA2_TC003722 [Tribolium castaneum]